MITIISFFGFWIGWRCLGDLGASEPSALPMGEGDKPKSYLNVAYANHEKAIFDLWRSSKPSNTPLVAFFHGGGFTGGSQRQVNAMIKNKRLLLKRGVSVASIGYPLKKKFFSFGSSRGRVRTKEEIFEYGHQAIVFLQKHADDFGIDPDQITLAGSSAGTEIAMHLTYTKKLQVRGCWAMNIHSFMKTDGWFGLGQPDLLAYSHYPKGNWLHKTEHTQKVCEVAKATGMRVAYYGIEGSGLPQLDLSTIEEKAIQFFGW